MGKAARERAKRAAEKANPVEKKPNLGRRRRRYLPEPEYAQTLVEPCAGDGCELIPFYRGPVVNELQLWFCWGHLRLWLMDEGKRETLQLLAEWANGRVWAMPISRYNKPAEKASS